MRPPRLDTALTGLVLMASAGTALAIPLLARNTEGATIWLLDALAILLVATLAMKTAADRRARKASQALWLLTENSGDMVCRISPAGDLLYVSPAGQDITGRRADRLTGRPLGEIVHRDDHPILHGLLRRLGERDTVQSARMRVGDDDHGWRWTETTARRVTDEHGALIEMHAVVRDIQERQRAEELTRRQRDRAEMLLVLGRRLAGHSDARALAHAALDGLCTLTGAQRGVIWSTTDTARRAEVMATRGLAPDEALGADADRELSGEWLYVPIAHGPKHLGGARLGWDADEPRDDFDRVALAQLADQIAAALAHALSLRDAIEQASIARAVLDAAPNGIELVDTGGARVMANPPLLRLMGDVEVGSVETLVNRVDDPIGLADLLVAVHADPELQARHEYTLLDSGRTIDCFTNPVRDSTGTLIGRIYVHREVTAERQAERLKDEFLALVSHELRTPLTSIMGYAEVLLDGEAGALRPGQRRFLEIVERNGQRLLRLVGDVLVVAQAEAGQLDLSFAPCDLAEVAVEAIDGARPKADDHGVELECRVDGPLETVADRTRLGQVIDNLLSNALAYTPPGGRVTITGGTDGSGAYVEVTDTGIGIPREECELLFQRFYRGKAGANSSGTGLGLAISRAIIEGHGGHIGVQSDEGAGASFRFWLPGAPTRRSSRQARQSAPVG